MTHQGNAERALRSVRGKILQPSQLISWYLKTYSGAINMTGMILRKFIESLFQNAPVETRSSVHATVGHKRQTAEKNYTLFNKRRRTEEGARHIRATLNSISVDTSEHDHAPSTSSTFDELISNISFSN